MNKEFGNKEDEFQKYISISINERLLLIKDEENKKIPFKCSFPNCENTYEILSKLKTHIRTHVIINFFNLF